MMMMSSPRFLTRCCQLALLLLSAPLVVAQGLRAPAQGGSLRPTPSLQPLALTSAPVAQRQSSDFIVAVVGSEPVTNLEVNLRAQSVEAQLRQQGQPLPAREQFLREVLDLVVQEKTQLQWAQEVGVQASDADVTQAEDNAAERAQMSAEQMRAQLARAGISLKQWRQDLRNQIVLQRLRDREVIPRIRPSEQEIDQYLRERQQLQEGRQELNLAQILIAVPEGATPEQAAQAERQARDLLTRLRAGEDFAQLARAHSATADRASGGVMGRRSPDRYPSLFMDAVRQQPEGAVVGPVRSGAGFHVLKVVERSAVDSSASVVQTHVRHILLRPGGQVSVTVARTELARMKQAIEAGRAEFAQLAREHSQDGSASAGGDLGWANPGMFVPEFEEAMNHLALNEVSDPLVSRYGVHLIQVLERRKTELSVRELREQARNALRESKFEETYQTWAQEIRGRSYVEFRDAPQ
jgi:peptidyl-prolyl cis-trans isomerase SurA